MKTEYGRTFFHSFTVEKTGEITLRYDGHWVGTMSRETGAIFIEWDNESEYDW